ncbi:smoothened homolog [Trichonephila clavipes]|nr:smoothened homolog [Trichonephila clavipes]
MGVPLQLHSDQGRNFVSAVLKGVCELLGIDKTKTTPLHPHARSRDYRIFTIPDAFLAEIFVSLVTCCLVALPDTPSSPERVRAESQARFEDVHHLARTDQPEDGEDEDSVDGDSMSGICFVGFANPTSRIWFLLIPVALAALASGFFLISLLYTLLKMRGQELANEKSRVKLHRMIRKISMFSIFAAILIICTFACHAYDFINRKDWMESLRDYIVCQAMNSAQPSSEFSVPICSLKNRPNISVMYLHVACMFAFGVLMSSWAWTKTSLNVWKRFFHSQMMHFLHPCLEYLDILLRHQGCIWWPAEQKICRQTKITSKEHLGWGIAGGLVNGTPVGKQEKGQFLVPVLLITGYQERGSSGWSDQTSLPCRQIENAKLLS